MAVPAAVAKRFPQSIRRDSSLLVIRIGAQRLALVELRDRARRNADAEGSSWMGREDARLAGLYDAMLREAA